MESVIVLPCAATGDSAAGARASTTRSATATPAKLREIVMERPSSASGASRMARRYATLPELSSRRARARNPDPHRARPAVRPRVVRHGGQRHAPPRRRPDARDRPVEQIFPRRAIDRPPRGPDDSHALEAVGDPRRFERRLGVDLEVRDARLAMIGLLEAVDERAALDRHAAARRLDPRVRLNEASLHRKVELDDVAAPPGALDAQIALRA